MYLHELLSLFLLLFFSNTAVGEEYFDVLDVKDVPFPESTFDAAILNVSYTKKIPEMTICYRHLIESFNAEWTRILLALHQSQPVFGVWLGMETGYEKAG